MTTTRPPSPTADSYRLGVVYAVLAFGWWAVLFPVMFVVLNHVVFRSGYMEASGASRIDWSLEITAHRGIWAFVTCVVLVWWVGQKDEAAALLRSPRARFLLALTALLSITNWAGFVYGTATDQLRYASLGYYINPLVSVALGVAVLGERLRRAQTIALVLAGVGVVWETVRMGQLPWLSLLVAFSFGFYGLFRKQIKASAISGLMIECGMLLPITVGYVVCRELWGPTPAFGRELLVSSMLVVTGIATAMPLIWFAHATNRLPLSSMAFLQFIVPTGQLLVAVTMNGESVGWEGLVSFAFIWLGVGAFLLDIRAATRAMPVEPSGGTIVELP
ncbi:EamA family transporter RarD [Aeoliella sp. SH292]|uniref:EamA family transporter RarD n=1 Tax=Aeoliella sp. SH292 TaxID=3454464 RepID=UPI003F94AD8A